MDFIKENQPPFIEFPFFFHTVYAELWVEPRSAARERAVVMKFRKWKKGVAFNYNKNLSESWDLRQLRHKQTTKITSG